MSDSEEVIPEKKGRGRPPAGDKADKVQFSLSSLQIIFSYHFFSFDIEAQSGARKRWLVTSSKEGSW